MKGDQRRRLRGGWWAAVGFILSPLSWWNDPVVNLPLAYAFGALFGLVSRRLFLPAMLVGYWLSNLIGLLLLHYGLLAALGRGGGVISRRGLVKNILISCAYTLLIVMLVKAGWLRLPQEYLPGAAP